MSEPFDPEDGVPCEVPLKVFLRPDPQVESVVIRAAEGAAKATVVCERRPSRNGNFVCLRLNVTVDSAARLQAVREAIGTCDGVLFGL